MSNFLQRIASTVAPAQARPRLQPMLGSIFGPSAFLGRDASGSLDARENHSETVAGRTQMGRYSGRADLDIASALAVGHPTTPSAPAPRFAAHDEPPLMPRYYGGEEPAQRRMGRAEQGDEEPFRRQVAESSQEEASFSSAASRAESADSSQISPPKPMWPAPTLMPISLQPLRAAVEPRTEQVRRAPAQRSEPDEIHIHIGRIEVASVAPPRVVAPPPRKSLSLDDYLRRGHGGQR